MLLNNPKSRIAAQHGVHADGWIHTVKLGFFMALGFVRFVGESRPASRRYPTPLYFGDFPLTGTMSFTGCYREPLGCKRRFCIVKGLKEIITVMEENAFGARTLKIINDLHRDGIKNYAVLTRHSARHYGTAENDESMGLTEEGKQTSFEFGKALPSSSSFRFFSSPAQRCVETSALIEKGCLSGGSRTQANRAMDDLSALFVKDMSKVMQMAYELAVAGDYPKFFRNWFDGKIPANLIDGASESAQKLLKALLELLQKPSEFAGNICVTHDWHLVLLKEYYLGQRAEEYGNIEYLEGVIIYKWNDSYHIINDQGETRKLKLS